MTLDELRKLLTNGQFHHATERQSGPSLWKGLHIYRNDPNGFRGFSHAGVFYNNDRNIEAARDLVSGTGVSFGAYGEG